MFKLLSLSLLSVASARTLRTSEDPAPVKIEDMAKFVGVSAKSEEASTKGGPVDWPPAGIGDVSRKNQCLNNYPGLKATFKWPGKAIAGRSGCRHPWCSMDDGVVGSCVGGNMTWRFFFVDHKNLD